MNVEYCLTPEAGGRILTNTGVWSPDSQWIVYDTRSDAAGEVFEGSQIEAVHVKTKEKRVLYQSQNGAHCGVVTWHPKEPKVIFILGPEQPTADWNYGAARRRGVIVDFQKPGHTTAFDGRDLVPPFTPGALRGGSHVHVFSPDGSKISFTYEDQWFSTAKTKFPNAEPNQRNVGIGVPSGTIRVGKGHPRNQDGNYFCVLITRTTSDPKPGSDEISKAFEEGWIGSNSLAFQGHVRTENAETISEVFIVHLPDDVRSPGDGPLQGTETQAPFPPKGTIQRRLTFTSKRKYPGIQGPRHWLRAAPDGKRIAFLMKDNDGLPQLWTISPNGGEPKQLSNTPEGIASAFSWSQDGERIACVSGGRIVTINANSGAVRHHTDRGVESEQPRPEACVFSPDGTKITYVRRKLIGAKESNQIFVAEC